MRWSLGRLTPLLLEARVDADMKIHSNWCSVGVATVDRGAYTIEGSCLQFGSPKHAGHRLCRYIDGLVSLAGSGVPDVPENISSPARIRGMNGTEQAKNSPTEQAYQTFHHV